MRTRVQGDRSGLGKWFLLACLLLLQGVAVAEIPFGNGLLFRIEKGDAQPSYLFGTVHLDDQRVLNLPQPVRAAFDESHTVVLEITLDETAILASAMGMLITDGRELRDLVGEELYLRTVTAMASRGVPEVALRHYKPWSVMTLLVIPQPETGLFLDLVLYQTARSEGKQLRGLESIEEQLAVFDEISEDDQVKMLEETLNNLDKLPTMFEEMLDAYLARDLETLMEINETYQELGDPELAKMFQKRLLESRNLRMVERLHPILEEGGAFIGVGALHLPGENGILNLLDHAGYRIEVVY
jgi:uncharacterized protein YbaP (TraB family)